MKIAEAQKGPIRAVLDVHGGALAMFRPKEADLVLRTSLQAGGDFWMAVFLPMRFGPYAKRLGYSVTGNWMRLKQHLNGEAVPFIGLTPVGGGPTRPRSQQRNGEKMIAAVLSKSRVETITKGGAREIILRIPYGHAIQGEKSAIFKRIPSHEIERMAEIIGRTLATIIAGSEVRTARGKATTTVNPNWRPPMAAKLRTTRTYASSSQYRTVVGSRSSVSSVLRPRSVR